MGSDYLKGLQEGVAGHMYIFKVPSGDSDVQRGLEVTLFFIIDDECEQHWDYRHTRSSCGWIENVIPGTIHLGLRTGGREQGLLGCP